MSVPRRWVGEPAIVLGTGPSLAGQIGEIIALRAANRCRLIGMNVTFHHFPVLDAFTACNIEWWEHYGHEFHLWWCNRRCEPWHWDKACATRWGLNWIEGRWGSGLSTDPTCIHLGHSSGVQALNLAVLYGCSLIVLVGYEMTEIAGAPRHYFTDQSDIPGEYPPPLRHHAKLSRGHEGLLPIYREIAAQKDLPPILNATPGGKLDCLPRKTLAEVFGE